MSAAPFGLRMPPALQERIKQQAKANSRSMNAEIVSQLLSGTEAMRDRFAGQAMAALIVANAGDLSALTTGAAKDAYAAADALMAVRGDTDLNHDNVEPAK